MTPGAMRPLLREQFLKSEYSALFGQLQGAPIAPAELVGRHVPFAALRLVVSLPDEPKDSGPVASPRWRSARVGSEHQRVDTSARLGVNVASA